MNTIQNYGSNHKNENKTKTKKNVKGALLGIGAGTLAQTAFVPVGMLAVNKMANMSRSLPEDKVQIINNTADNIIDNVTNLAKKGVKISNVKSGQGFITTDFLGVKLPKWIRNMVDTLQATANGKNAFFSPLFNEICINKEKLPLAVFHELGHAYNFNNSRFWKSMQNIRKPVMAASACFAMIPIFYKECKAKDGQELTDRQKANNILRNASPALAFASMLPMLSEEAVASIRGCSWAKQLLDKDLYKKVIKNNVVAYTTYLTTALGSAAFALAAKKVKDHFQTKKELETQKARTDVN